MIGDIEMATTDGRLLFRRVARPNVQRKRILQTLDSICLNA
jgi:hypothetical protein